MRSVNALLLVLLAVWPEAVEARRKPKKVELSPLDKYVEDASQRAADPVSTTPGSLWSPVSRLADGARDSRASQVDDMVTILVSESASAVAKGSTKSARSSSVKNSVTALAGVTRAAGPLANLATLGGDSQLTGEGATSRQTVLSATLTARVTRVLPGGSLLLEGTKNLQVNGESQSIVVRGVARPADVSPANLVRSDRLAQLEVRVNGKGVVGDAVRRPFILYRILLGILPM
jgi:flagellar L-ring protein precursor FlgH